MTACLTTMRAARCSLGWGLGAYRFTRYRQATRAPARLVLAAPDAETAAILAACWRVRDLVNTPTQDMGPQELESGARHVHAHGACAWRRWKATRC